MEMKRSHWQGKSIVGIHTCPESKRFRFKPKGRLKTRLKNWEKILTPLRSIYSNCFLSSIFLGYIMKTFSLKREMHVAAYLSCHHYGWIRSQMAFYIILAKSHWTRSLYSPSYPPFLKKPTKPKPASGRGFFRLSAARRFSGYPSASISWILLSAASTPIFRAIRYLFLSLYSPLIMLHHIGLV